MIALTLALATPLACLGCKSSSWPQRAQAAGAEASGTADVAPAPEGAKGEAAQPWAVDAELAVTAAPEAATVRQMAEKDPLSLLSLARQNYESAVRDYTVTMVKQERDGKGRLGKEETVFCKFLREPRGVFLQWKAGADRIDKALYAPTLVGSDVVIHPTGMAGLLASSLKLSPDGEHGESLKRVTSFGFASVYDLLIERGRDALGHGDLTTVFLGEMTVEGQAAMAFQWLLPAGRGYPCGRIVVYLCRETLLPLTITTWDWAEQLQSKYVYKDLRANLALTATDFSRKACGLE